MKVVFGILALVVFIGGVMLMVNVMPVFAASLVGWHLIAKQAVLLIVAMAVASGVAIRVLALLMKAGDE